MESPVKRGNTPPDSKKPDAYYVRLALRIAADFGVSIAVPALVATYVGQKLDTRFQSHPWLLIACLVVAFTLTAHWLVKKAKIYQNMYEA